MRGGERGREREREGGGGDRVRGERENKWEITSRKQDIFFEFSPKPKAQDSESFENFSRIQESSKAPAVTLPFIEQIMCQVPDSCFTFSIYLIHTTNGVTLQRNYHHFIDEET